MRRREPVVSDVSATPALDLLRCPWTSWQDGRVELFDEWLARRQRWRETHAEPLPALFSIDRFAMTRLPGLDPVLVAAETAARSQAGPRYHAMPGDSRT